MLLARNVMLSSVGTYSAYAGWSPWTGRVCRPYAEKRCIKHSGGTPPLSPSNNLVLNSVLWTLTKCQKFFDTWLLICKHFFWVYDIFFIDLMFIFWPWHRVIWLAAAKQSKQWYFLNLFSTCLEAVPYQTVHNILKIQEINIYTIRGFVHINS